MVNNRLETDFMKDNQSQSKSSLEEGVKELDGNIRDALDNIFARAYSEKNPGLALDMSIILSDMLKSGYPVDGYIEKFDDIIAEYKIGKYSNKINKYANNVFMITPFRVKQHSKPTKYVKSLLEKMKGPDKKIMRATYNLMRSSTSEEDLNAVYESGLNMADILETNTERHGQLVHAIKEIYKKKHNLMEKKNQNLLRIVA